MEIWLSGTQTKIILTILHELCLSRMIRVINKHGFAWLVVESWFIRKWSRGTTADVAAFAGFDSDVNISHSIIAMFFPSSLVLHLLLS